MGLTNMSKGKKRQVAPNCHGWLLVVEGAKGVPVAKDDRAKVIAMFENDTLHGMIGAAVETALHRSWGLGGSKSAITLVYTERYPDCGEADYDRSGCVQRRHSHRAYLHACEGACKSDSWAFIEKRKYRKAFARARIRAMRRMYF
jgi:hypothetical protein